MVSGKKPSIPETILNVAANAASDKEGYKVSREEVAKKCGYPKQPTVYMNALRSLQKKGYLTYDKTSITVYQLGFDNADMEAAPKNNEQQLEKAKEKFKSQKQKQILDIVFDGGVHSYVEIANVIGADHNKRSFQNLLGPLKSSEYVIYTKDADGKKALEAHDSLFPFGRP
jgi:alkylated DNA nucleotide flippase Atl1